MMSEKAVSYLTISIPRCSLNVANKVLRVVLYRNESYRVSRSSREIQILSGVAWTTVAKEDVILRQGESISCTSGEDTLISALGRMPLILEIR
jgi:quercetin dioxygenase-like cupin family protein